MLSARTAGLVAWAALALAGCGSGGGSSAPSSSTGAPAGTTTDEGRVVGHLHTSVIPAGMVDPLRFGYPPSDSVMYPVVDAWAVADHRSEVDVYAGGASPVQGSSRADDGLFVINRYSFLPLRQTQKHVVVRDSGPLRITAAPRGRSVVTSAQGGGLIHFASKGGVRGTLHLSDDTVTLEHP